MPVHACKRHLLATSINPLSRAVYVALSCPRTSGITSVQRARSNGFRRCVSSPSRVSWGCGDLCVGGEVCVGLCEYFFFLSSYFFITFLQFIVEGYVYKGMEAEIQAIHNRCKRKGFGCFGCLLIMLLTLRIMCIRICNQKYILHVKQKRSWFIVGFEKPFDVFLLTDAYKRKSEYIKDSRKN